jgi:hypothetical protein
MRDLSARFVLAVLGFCLVALGNRSAHGADYRLSTFSADVTPPIGHPLMGGGIAPAKTIVDPLFARGFVLLGAGKPIILVAVDWCEIRNDAYERWRTVLAQAADTDPRRVMVASVHQHDTPVADLEAERILEKRMLAGRICDLAFHERAVQRVAAALRDSLPSARRVTHLGTGEAKVENVASNRRYTDRAGKVAFGRTSATRDEWARAQPEGTIDPWLKTISFWDVDKPLVALTAYATHPMSYYGKGGVSSDFVGLARNRRQAAEPEVFQIYVSGCSGNVTAGKFNDGSPENRPVLAGRVEAAMTAAWEATRRRPLEGIRFRTVPLRLEPRDAPGFSVDGLKTHLTPETAPFQQCLAALGLSWRLRADAGHTIDLPVLELADARMLLMPGESYVEYQLLAQRMRPDLFVMTIGYGESATGYIPTEKAVAEDDTNLRDWCWVAPGAEKAMTAALEAALKPAR